MNLLLNPIVDSRRRENADDDYHSRGDHKRNYMDGSGAEGGSRSGGGGGSNRGGSGFERGERRGGRGGNDRRPGEGRRDPPEYGANRSESFHHQQNHEEVRESRDVSSVDRGDNLLIIVFSLSFVLLQFGLWEHLTELTGCFVSLFFSR